MNVQNVLRDLDKHASEFNFPVLDNAYVEMAAARLTAFRNTNEWVIDFEVLGFSNRQGIFSDDLYGFGTCLREEGFISSTPVLHESPSYPMTNSETGAWIADWESWAAIVRGKSYYFAPTREEYLSAGIEVPSESGPGSLREGQVMRFFIEREGADDLFMREDELRTELQLVPNLPIFLQTEQWQHPDIAGEEKPSMNPALRSLVGALQNHAPEKFIPGEVNTRWSLWMNADEYS